MSHWLRVTLAAIQGTIWSLAVALFLFAIPIEVAMPTPGGFWSKLFIADFASRWEGSCSGWTSDVAVVHIVGNLLLWWAYVTIATVMARLHPILQSVTYSGYTLLLICAIFVSCGATHLFDAWTFFHPLYRATGLFLILSGLIGLVGAVLVAHSLDAAFAIVHSKDLQAEAMAKRLMEYEKK